MKGLILTVLFAFLSFTVFAEESFDLYTDSEGKFYVLNTLIENEEPKYFVIEATAGGLAKTAIELADSRLVKLNKVKPIDSPQELQVQQEKMLRAISIQKSETVVPMAISPTAAVASAAINASVSYTYDELGRLTRVTHLNGKKTSYGYDKADNRTSKSVN